MPAVIRVVDNRTVIRVGENTVLAGQMATEAANSAAEAATTAASISGLSAEIAASKLITDEMEITLHPTQRLRLYGPDGNLAFFATTDGVVAAHSVLLPNQEQIVTNPLSMPLRIQYPDGSVMGFDHDGHVIGNIDPSRVRRRGRRAVVTPLAQLFVGGDSLASQWLTDGIASILVGPGTDLKARDVINFNIGGQKVDQIVARANGIGQEARITLAAGTLDTTTVGTYYACTVTDAAGAPLDVLDPPNTATITRQGWLVGVPEYPGKPGVDDVPGMPVTLRRVDAGPAYSIRFLNNAGADQAGVVNVPDGAVMIFEPTYRAARGRQVYVVGRNNIDLAFGSAERRTELNRLIALVRAIEVVNPDYLFVEVLPKNEAAEYTGAANRLILDAWNDELEELVGKHRFVRVNHYLTSQRFIDDALAYDAELGGEYGYAALAAGSAATDAADIANGVVPGSLKKDGTHPSFLGDRVLGRFIGRYAAMQGW